MRFAYDSGSHCDDRTRALSQLLDYKNENPFNLDLAQLLIVCQDYGRVAAIACAKITK